MRKQTPDRPQNEGATTLALPTPRCAGARGAAWIAIGFLCLASASARAEISGLEDGVAFLSPRPLNKSNLLSPPSRAYSGLPVGGWMMYPSLLAGAVVDDNIRPTSQSRTSGTGLRFKPTLSAIQTNGIHNTQLYAEADARVYPDQSKGNLVEGRLGGVYTYEMTRDLMFRFKGEAARREEVFNDAVGYALTAGSPQRYNQFSGSASVKKSMGQFFAAFGGTVSRKSYTDSETPFGALPDQTVTTLSGRTGVWATPAVYAFVEPSVNWRRFDSAAGFDSSGYRVVGGVGSDQVSLFRGEIFGGYQQQSFEASPFGTISGAIAGGRLFWLPTRALTFAIQIDQTLGESTTLTTVNPTGSATRTRSMLAKADYSIARLWSAQSRIGLDHVDYVDGPRRDKRWLAGATLNYDLFRNFGLALDYQFTRVDSNLSFASYEKNVVTLGGTYKY